MKKYAIPLLAWLAVMTLLMPWTMQLSSLLSYDEQIFMPKDAESVKGLELLEDLGILNEDVIIVIVEPNDYETVKSIEKALAGIPDIIKIVGPASTYDTIISKIESAIINMTLILESANSTYTLILSKLNETVNTLREIETILNGTYGTAELFLKIASLYSAMGAEDPYYMAYRDLRNLTPEDLSWFVDGFYSNFRLLINNGYEPLIAADRAVKMASLANPIVWAVVKEFNIDNYRDRDKIIEFIYKAGGLEESSIDVSELKVLLNKGNIGAIDVVKSKMRKEGAPDCLLEGFELVAKGIDAREAVESACSQLVSIPQYPDGIPHSIRRLLLNGSYSAIYVYLDGSFTDPRKIVNEIIDVIKNNADNYYLYGNLVLERDLRESLSNDVSRIDKTTSLLVIIILLLLLKGLGAPMVILLTTGIALLVAMGLIGLIAWSGFDVYYLSRLLVIPLVFGVTVDYSIFYLYRIAEEHEVVGWPKALEVARRRASRALILGGVSVVIGFAAYLVSPSEALRSIGASFVIAAIVSFLSSLTLLPGLIGVLGINRVFWPNREPPKLGGGHALLLRRMAEVSINQPVKIAIIVLTVVLALFSLMLVLDIGITSDIRLSLGGEGLYINGEEIYSNYFDISVVSKVFIIGGEHEYDYREVNSIVDHISKIEDIAYVRYLNTSNAKRPIFEAGLNTAPFSDSALEAVDNIRTALRELGYVDWIVTGAPALRKDLVDYVNDSFYYFTLPIALIGIIVYLSLGMGSIPMPLRLLATILASSVASLALTSVVFSSLYGVKLYWIVPLIVLGLMITLGLDYDIFLATRLREEMKEERSQDEALVEAVERSGLVITACGVILAGAFGSLMISESLLLKQAGLAIASSILIDTFIIRPIVAPAVISLAGSRNWWPGRGLFRKWD